MNPTSIIQLAPDRVAVTQLRPGSKRATGAEEDIASGSAAAGEPLFQIRQDFSAATYLLEVRHLLLAPAARPGQFVIVQSHDRGERIRHTERLRNFSAVALGYTLENARRFNHPSPYLKGKVNTIIQIWRNLVKQDETQK